MTARGDTPGLIFYKIFLRSLFAPNSVYRASLDFGAKRGCTGAVVYSDGFLVYGTQGTCEYRRFGRRFFCGPLSRFHDLNRYPFAGGGEIVMTDKFRAFQNIQGLDFRRILRAINKFCRFLLLVAKQRAGLYGHSKSNIC